MRGARYALSVHACIAHGTDVAVLTGERLWLMYAAGPVDAHIDGAGVLVIAQYYQRAGYTYAVGAGVLQRTFISVGALASIECVGAAAERVAAVISAPVIVITVV